MKPPSLNVVLPIAALGKIGPKVVAGGQQQVNNV